MSIANALVEAGLQGTSPAAADSSTHDPLARAQSLVTPSWLSARATPAIAAAIDRACFNRFSSARGHGLSYRTFELSLAPESTSDSPALVLKGSASATIDSKESLPIAFNVDLSTGFAELSDESDDHIRAWISEVYDESVSGQTAHAAAVKAMKLVQSLANHAS